jgi:hypothetical protein
VALSAASSAGLRANRRFCRQRGWIRESPASVSAGEHGTGTAAGYDGITGDERDRLGVAATGAGA